MEQFAVWCDVVRESTHVVDPAAVVSTNIVEVRPLEDRPRRLFVEGGVAAIDEGESSPVLDGILGGLRGLGEVVA